MLNMNFIHLVQNNPLHFFPYSSYLASHVQLLRVVVGQ